MGRYLGYALDNVQINSGTAALDSLTVDGAQVQTDGIVEVTSSTVSITAASHAGKLVVLNRAAGIAVTLPAATGTGNTYRFVLGADVTSNSTTIKVADATDVIAGAVIVTNEADSTTTTYGTAASDDTVTMNGGSQGGLAGSQVTLIDVATNLWAISGVLVGTGGEADPLSATVS